MVKCVILACCLAFVCLTAMAASPTEQLQAQLQQLQSFQAKFTQTLRDAQGVERDHSAGRVWLQRPGKFRWHTSTPTEQIIVANGDQLWIYDVDLAQVIKQPIDKQSRSNPASLLSQASKTLASQYDIKKTVAASRVCARATISRISLTPANTAEIVSKCPPAASANKRAKVVLPVPGGPHRIIECKCPCTTA